jgi:hypothetical protein
MKKAKQAEIINLLTQHIKGFMLFNTYTLICNLNCKLVNGGFSPAVVDARVEQLDGENDPLEISVKLADLREEWIKLDYILSKNPIEESNKYIH